MSNGHGAHAALEQGHFLFTSESVGEGHPGMCQPSVLIVTKLLITLQTRFATKSLMLS